MKDQAEAITKYSDIMDKAGSVNDFIGMVADVAFEIVAMVHADKCNEIEADFELTEADHEQILSILADCGQDISRILQRALSNAGKRETILTSASNEASHTNDILSTIEG